jgi:hypothetical protein
MNSVMKQMNPVIAVILMAAMMSLMFLYMNMANTMGNTGDFATKSFEEKRGEVLAEMDMAIEHATLEGNYKCCIDPPCTMCFLGHWIWGDGTCDCDGMIAAGEWDKVCPECKSGIEEGRCLSTIKVNQSCPVFVNGNSGDFK